MTTEATAPRWPPATNPGTSDPRVGGAGRRPEFGDRPSEIRTIPAYRSRWSLTAWVRLRHNSFLLDHGTDVDAVALTGTAALDLLEPALDLSSDLDLSAFNAPFEPARTDYDWLSRDESIVDAYLADPLCGFGIDAASAKDMFAGARRLADHAEVARMPHYLPLYVAVGSKDPVNADLGLLWPLVDRYRDAGLSDVTVRVYDDARHEILNETNRSEVIDDLLKWLQQGVGASAGARRVINDHTRTDS